jgi:hypothetical protein
VKNAKMCYVGAVEDISFYRKSKSPSVSSFSRRSCMSKTPSKSNNGVKRPVRFYPNNAENVKIEIVKILLYFRF